MTLKELINRYSYQNKGVYSLIDIEELCKEYAKTCLEKAADEATFIMTIQPIKKDGFIEGYSKVPVINKESITNIELP